jgi:predicted DNA-binding ribbon-helix-helix protein
METGSMLAAERGEEPAAAQPAPEPGDGEPVFRVVMARGGRKGIRLERIFWRVVSDLAAARRETLGTVVADAADNVPANGNLASTLRVQAARWLQDRLTELERLTAAENVYSIVHATPSPAFVLTADKRIVRYNQPFLNFLQARLLASQSPDLMRAVRLTLDLHVEQVIEQLLQNPKLPVATGFALGVSDRRVRGQVKLVLAPTHEAAMVIAYIVQA